MANVPAFETTIVHDGSLSHGDLGCDSKLAITTLEAVRWDEDVEEARYHKCTYNEDDHHMHKHEAVDVGWIVGNRV
jgi:hypothetical protein